MLRRSFLRFASSTQSAKIKMRIDCTTDNYSIRIQSYKDSNDNDVYYLYIDMKIKQGQKIFKSVKAIKKHLSSLCGEVDAFDAHVDFVVKALNSY